MKKDLAVLEREADEFRAEARALLERNGNGDLAGDDAARFDTLTGQIESHNGEIRAIQDHNRRLELIRSAGTPGSTMSREGEGVNLPGYGGPDGSEDRSPALHQRDAAMRGT